MKYLLFSTVTEVSLLLTELMSSFFKETRVWGKYIKALNLERRCHYWDILRNEADRYTELVSEVL
jgi:hypothetical protein